MLVNIRDAIVALVVSVLWMSHSASGAELLLGTLTTNAHQVTGDVYLLSERIMEIRGFTYDGAAPAAYFWADTNPSPTVNGIVLSDGSPSSGCALAVGDPELPALSSVTQRVEFPDGVTIRDFLGGSVSVWCEAFAANFGSIQLPAWLDESEIPQDGPALECNTGATEAGGQASSGSSAPAIAQTPEGYNCEPLNDDYQVRWKVNGDFIDIELVGIIPDDSYMAFGVSGLTDSTFMIGADVTIADMPSAGGGARARDFFIDARAQCSGVSGVCSDSESGFNDDVTNVSGEKDDDLGVTVVRFTRPLSPNDTGAASPGGGSSVDRAISVATGVPTFIAWALGPIDPSTGNPLFHSIAFARQDGNDVTIEFGRSVVDDCPPIVVGDGSTTEAPTGPPPPFVRPFLGDDETTFDVHIGPSGGPRGYSAITGLPSWGIAWWVNGYLIPELVLRRGTKYTFRVNGGDDPSDGANYHPFYLTTSEKGGYFQLSPEERLDETPLAGITITWTDSYTGAVKDFDVLGLAPICRYETTSDSAAAELLSFDEYAETIDMSCADDEWLTNRAGIIEFTPDAWTPDIIYYQCVTHFNLGFKIRVIDEDAPAVTASPTQSPEPDLFQADDNLDAFQSVALSGQIEQGSLQFKFNPADPRANGKDTISIVYETPVLAWAGWAVNNNGGFMVGSEAVIGLPDTGEVLKYRLEAQSVNGVQPVEDTKQTLIDASITQEDGTTTLRFTKILVEEGEIPINIVGDNTFLSSWGFSNTLGVHAARGSYLLSGEALVTRKQSLWKAHGWLMAIAWGILCPMAIASSVLRRFFPGDGLWFQFHRGLNVSVVLFTVVGFIIAVVALNQDTPDGAAANHFSSEFANGHRLFGLIIFILALMQALGGILRPHLPSNPNKASDEENGTPEEAPKPKSIYRKMWELLHKGMGIGILGFSWYQVQLGIKTYGNIFNAGDYGAALPAFWATIGTLGTIIAAGYVLKAVAPQK